MTRGVRAGTSAARIFRRRRREKIRLYWRSWALLGVMTLGSLGAIVPLDGLLELVAAGTTGALVAFGLAMWEIGDVRALTYAWGSVGEQRTGDVLGALGDDWHVEHDIARRGGNWDHLLVGPPGVFVLETKQLMRPAVVRNDALVVGRFSTHQGGTTRGALWSCGSISAPTHRGCRGSSWCGVTSSKVSSSKTRWCTSRARRSQTGYVGNRTNSTCGAVLSSSRTSDRFVAR